MNIQNAIEILTHHQEWRVGKRDDMVHPSKITESLGLLLNEVKKLQQHSVMQAKGSDVSEGATVASSAVGKGVREDDEYTRGYKAGWRDCCNDVKEFG